MRPIHAVTALFAALLLAMTACGADAQDGDRAPADDADLAVADGGIFAPAWAGIVDPRAAEAGMSIDDSRFAFAADGAIHITTGPASTYWHSEEPLAGEYTVSATFTEPRYMNLNDHPHPYGIVIAGNAMGTDEQSFVYCAAYGDGRFIVRGFGPEPFQLNGRRGEEHDAVNRAPDRYEPVTQQIAMAVRDGQVSCAINGTVVASYPIDEVVAEGRLASTDGAYGVRAAHNTDVLVSDLRVTRH